MIVSARRMTSALTVPIPIRSFTKSFPAGVTHFVRICQSCRKANPLEQNGSHGMMPVIGLFHAWSIDFAGPMKEAAAVNK